MRRPNFVPRLPRRAILVAFALALALDGGLAPVGPPARVSASTPGTAETMEARVLSLLNPDRVARGLVPYRLHSSLVTLSGDRATALGSADVLSHSAPGCLACQLDSRSIQWYGYGEALGVTSLPPGDQAATSLYGAWKASPAHWAMLMSEAYNYLGVGVASNAMGTNTYVSIVLTESVDQTRPWARMATRSARGTTVTWTWKGADNALQTHTAGLKSFDVEYRVGSGTFRTLWSSTSATSLTLKGRPRGRWYGIRVRSRDNRGLLSNWTPELRVWVP